MGRSQNARDLAHLFPSVSSWIQNVACGQFRVAFATLAFLLFVLYYFSYNGDLVYEEIDMEDSMEAHYGAVCEGEFFQSQYYIDSGYACSQYSSPDGRHPQCCCRGPDFDGENLICLPYYFIIGAQKGGTTALAATLLLHPNTQAPREKELHLYDIRSMKTDRFLDFFRYAEKYIPYTPVSNVSVTVVGDATPGYFPMRMAPGRIRSMFPHARMVLMVREPVSRAYSEFQMCSRYRDSNCLQKYNNQDQHANNTYTCLKAAEQLLDVTIYPPSDGNIDLSLWAKDYMYWEDWTKEFSGTQLAYTWLRVPGEKSMDATVDCFPEKKRSQVRDFLLSHKPDDLVEVFTVADAAGDRHFTAQFLKESLKIPGMCILSKRFPEDVLIPQVDALLECNGPPRVTNNTYLSVCQDARGLESNPCSFNIQRGMYAEQLRFWLEEFEPKNILIVENVELLRDRVGTMEKILSFFNLPQYDYSQTTDDMVTEAIDEYFSNLYDLGWSQNGYGPLDDGVRLELAKFFAPLNEDFFSLVGKDFGWNDQLDEVNLASDTSEAGSSDGREGTANDVSLTNQFDTVGSDSAVASGDREGTGNTGDNVSVTGPFSAVVSDSGEASSGSDQGIETGSATDQA